MKNILIVFGLLLVCGALAAQETSEKNDEKLDKEKKIISCPVPTIINGKDVFVQPVRFIPVSDENLKEGHKLFKVEPYCDGEDPEKNDSEAPDPENDDNDEDEGADDAKSDDEAFIKSAEYHLSNWAGLQNRIEETNNDPNQTWVIRPFFGIGWDYPLLVSVPMGAYVEDPETTNGFIIQFAPGIDGYKVGAGISTGFRKDSGNRSSLMLIVGQDGRWNESAGDGDSFWENPEDASTFVGLSLLYAGIAKKSWNYTNPGWMLGLGYGYYIDGDQHDEDANLEESDLFIFQLGINF